MQLHTLTLTQASTGLCQKEFSSVELVQACLNQIEKYNPILNSFITIVTESALTNAQTIDKRRSRGEDLHPLAGIPFAVKDAICTRGIRSTAGAKILDNYIPPYTATVIQKLLDCGAIIIGKNNCDAFGHGASNENSDYGPAKNPWDMSKVSGGSSGGSAAAVASDMCIFAIGEDTGGSIRQPAAFCNITGLKVSYGRNSRYGIMPMASSLDTVGPMTKTAEDAAWVEQIIAGQDSLDATTFEEEVPNYTEKLSQPLSGLRIGIPKEYLGDGIEKETKDAVEAAVSIFEKLGATLLEVSLPYSKYAVATYYIVVPSEDSSNMARFDGMRYGVRVSENGLRETYFASRAQGLLAEVKRRIMIGTYALSAGYYDAYYKKAQQVRSLIIQDFERVFTQVDALITPTSPFPPFAIGEKSDNPLQMYLADICLSGVSLAGIPGMSIPCGFTKNNLPIGMQIVGPRLQEGRILHVGYQFQQVSKWHLKKPSLN